MRPASGCAGKPGWPPIRYSPKAATGNYRQPNQQRHAARAGRLAIPRLRLCQQAALHLQQGRCMVAGGDAALGQIPVQLTDLRLIQVQRDIPAAAHPDVAPQRNCGRAQSHHRQHGGGEPDHRRVNSASRERSASDSGAGVATRLRRPEQRQGEPRPDRKQRRQPEQRRHHIERRSQPDEVAVAGHHPGDHLAVAIPRNHTLAHDAAQIARQIGAGILDAFVLAHQAAQLAAVAFGARLLRRVGQHFRWVADGMAGAQTSKPISRPRIMRARAMRAATGSGSRRRRAVPASASAPRLVRPPKKLSGTPDRPKSIATRPGASRAIR